MTQRKQIINFFASTPAYASACASTSFYTCAIYLRGSPDSGGRSDAGPGRHQTGPLLLDAGAASHRPTQFPRQRVTFFVTSRVRAIQGHAAELGSSGVVGSPTAATSRWNRAEEAADVAHLSHEARRTRFAADASPP